MNNKVIKAIKKGSFTIEAAVLIPVAATIIALLIGFVFYMHENATTEAIAYESEFLAVQKTVNKTDMKEAMDKRIENRLKESKLGFGEYRLLSSVGSSEVSVEISGQILPKVFNELFTRKGKATIARTDPVFIKRLMWIGSQLKESE